MRLFSLKRSQVKISLKIDTRNHSINHVSKLFEFFFTEKITRRRSCFQKNWICRVRVSIAIPRSLQASFVIKFSTRGRPRPSLRESWNDSDRLHDLSPSNSNEESCSFSGDDRNFNGHSHISAGDAANGTSLHAFNGLPTYLPTYLRTYISLILIAPRPASIASICITRTYIYTRIYTYRSLRFVALSRSDTCPFASIRPFPRSAGCTPPGVLSLEHEKRRKVHSPLFSSLNGPSLWQRETSSLLSIILSPLLSFPFY